MKNSVCASVVRSIALVSLTRPFQKIVRIASTYIITDFFRLRKSFASFFRDFFRKARGRPWAEGRAALPAPKGRGLCPHLLETFLEKRFQDFQKLSVEGAWYSLWRIARSKRTLHSTVRGKCNTSCVWVRHQPVWECSLDRRNGTAASILVPPPKMLTKLVYDGIKPSGCGIRAFRGTNGEVQAAPQVPVE